MADPVLRRMADDDLRERAKVMHKVAAEALRQAAHAQRAEAAALRELKRRNRERRGREVAGG